MEFFQSLLFVSGSVFFIISSTAILIFLFHGIKVNKTKITTGLEEE